MINKNSKLINNLYATHSNNIISKKDEEFILLFEHFNDLVSNIYPEDLRKKILYSHIEIEDLLYNYIISTSKTFYELGFNDFKELIFKKQKID